MKRIVRIIGVIFLLFLSVDNFAQQRIKQIENQLDVMLVDIPALDEKVEMSVSGVSIQEFMRGIAEAHQLNISVDPSINQDIVNNFSNATVSDVLIFVCKEYQLDINFIGSIMSIVKYIEPEIVVEEKIITPKELKIEYKKMLGKLSLDLKNDSLSAVAKAITQKTKKNVVLASGVGPQLVTVYIEDMPFDNALEKFGLANNLMLTKTEDDFYILDKIRQPNKGSSKTNNRTNRNQRSPSNNQESDFVYEAKDAYEISLSGTDVSIEEVIKTIANEVGVDYYFVSDIKDKTTINIKSTSFKDLLEDLLQGTDLTYEYKKGIYIIGERKTEGLRRIKIIQMQHRSVEKIAEIIPSVIQEGVDVKEFLDLNSLILSGSQPRIEEIELFVKKIDKLVPVVMIEVMIIDYSNSRANSVGVEAGIGENPSNPSGVTSGTLLPEPNMSLNSSSINNILGNLSGYGLLNFGKVTSSFYLNIRALETQGILKVRSTPRLSTLNGNEATMTIGKTEYYVVETNTVTSNSSTTSQSSRSYNPVTADLTITIKPFVSGDDQITLDITFSQSDFTGKIEPGAPPGNVSRTFTSKIRVKNEEMILLGGLEEKSSNESGRGVPFLSRIPIIKWLFSSRTKTKSKTKLNIFIKPTVIY